MLGIRRGHAVRRESAEGLEYLHRLGDLHVVDAVDGAGVHAQILEGGLELFDHRAALALGDGDGAGGHRRVIGINDLQQLLGGDARLGQAQILLELLDDADHLVSIGSVVGSVVIAQVVEAVLKIQHIVAGAAPAQIVLGDAQERRVTHAVLTGVGGDEQQRAQILVLFAALVDVYAGARLAVLGDEVGVLHAQADAAVGGRIAELGNGLLIHGAVVLAVEGDGVEEVGVIDLRRPLYPGVGVGHPVPFRALVVALLAGHVPGAGGRLVLRARGAEHLPGDGVVPSVVDGDDLVGQIHLDVIGHVVLREGGECAQQEDEDQKYGQRSLELHVTTSNLDVLWRENAPPGAGQT